MAFQAMSGASPTLRALPSIGGGSVQPEPGVARGRAEHDALHLMFSAKGDEQARHSPAPDPQPPRSAGPTKCARAGRTEGAASPPTHPPAR